MLSTVRSAILGQDSQVTRFRHSVCIALPTGPLNSMRGLLHQRESFGLPVSLYATPLLLQYLLPTTPTTPMRDACARGSGNGVDILSSFLN